MHRVKEANIKKVMRLSNQDNLPQLNTRYIMDGGSENTPIKKIARWGGGGCDVLDVKKLGASYQGRF